MKFQTLLERDGFILLDGAMGTTLQNMGLPAGASMERVNLEHPDWIVDIHSAYIEAGANIVYTNTFGANREKLEHAGLTPEEVIPQAIALAKQAAQGTEALVALDIGPIGQMLEPLGSLRFEDAYELFAEQVRLGAQAGADLVVIETMSDLMETKAAILAVKETSDLPVLCTMSFEQNRRTFVGCSISAMALTLEGLGVDAIGINCSLGPREMPPIVEELLAWTTLPVVVKPNAGLPNLSGGYDVTPEEFANSAAEIAKLGVKILGGCCGTTPAFLAEVKSRLDTMQFSRDLPQVPAAVCSGTKTVPIDRVRIIGERINPTGKKRFKQALMEQDTDYILSQAIEQVEAGADILDVNVGLPEIDEEAVLVSTVKALQSITDTPLQLDSSEPQAIVSALRAYCGKPVVNSVNGEAEVLDNILPAVKKYGAAVVGLTLDRNGIPKTAEERFAIAKRILEAAEQHGIRKEDVYIDCLTLTVSAEQAAAAETLRAVKMVKEQLGLKTVLGVSNISFGLPSRPMVNQNFLAMAMTSGLDLPIINPNVEAMTAAVRCYHLLTNQDPDAQEFIAAYGGTAAAPTPVKTEGTNEQRSLEELVLGGLKGEAAAVTKMHLQTMAPLEIVNQLLTPALDTAGADFEVGKIFLPQLIKAAGAAQAAFEVIKQALAATNAGSVSKGKIVMATVKGDIHDIGKNIVKVLLENYGYTVYDLGRDVDPQRVVDTVREHEIPLVGLSALMTTTLKSMEETIALLHQEQLPCKVMVGGAVLTADYAAKIGADFYAKDAKESVDIAKRIFGS